MKTITKYCKENRKKFTASEKELRRWLLNNLKSTRFRTQRPFDFYIVDFLFPLKRIVVEVDGGYHNSPAQIQKDERRTRYLESKGLRVIRITNEQVMRKDLLWLKHEIENTPDTDIKDFRLLYGTSAY